MKKTFSTLITLSLFLFAVSVMAQEQNQNPPFFHHVYPLLIFVDRDCNDDKKGTAYLDNCNACVGGNTDQTACTQDCNGDWGGTAYLDDCAICVGGTTGLTACTLIPGLEYIVIEGPTSIDENSDIQYSCRAHYSDGTNQVIEPDNWAIDCSSASISNTGLVSAYEVGSDQVCTIAASYSENSFTATDTFEVTIRDGSQEPLLRIMPLGNSITEGVGSTTNAGYRRDLYFSLNNAGYNLDFVGSLQDGSLDFDNDHEGHRGWRAEQIRDNVYNWLANNPADIVLLHIGTNDIVAGQDASGVALEVEEILDNIDQYEYDSQTEISICLALIINQSNPASSEGLITTEFNDLLQAMADSRIASGDNILVVDQENALTYPDDMSDRLHPDDIGYGKMADMWNSTLSTLLNPM